MMSASASLAREFPDWRIEPHARRSRLLVCLLAVGGGWQGT